MNTAETADTRYIILDNNDDTVADDCTAEEAARLVLEYNEHVYDVRREGDVTVLYHGKSRDSWAGTGKLVRTNIFSFRGGAAAEAQIWAEVIDRSEELNGLWALTEAVHRRMQAEIEY